jgi:hypothetical protein
MFGGTSYLYFYPMKEATGSSEATWHHINLNIYCHENFKSDKSKVFLCIVVAYLIVKDH